MFYFFWRVKNYMAITFYTIYAMWMVNVNLLALINVTNASYILWMPSPSLPAFYIPLMFVRLFVLDQMFPHSTLIMTYEISGVSSAIIPRIVFFSLRVWKLLISSECIDVAIAAHKWCTHRIWNVLQVRLNRGIGFNNVWNLWASYTIIHIEMGSYKRVQRASPT